MVGKTALSAARGDGLFPDRMKALPRPQGGAGRWHTAISGRDGASMLLRNRAEQLKRAPHPTG